MAPQGRLFHADRALCLGKTSGASLLRRIRDDELGPETFTLRSFIDGGYLACVASCLHQYSCIGGIYFVYTLLVQ